MPEPHNAAVASPWLTVAEAQVRARCGRRVIYQAIWQGKLKATRVGRGYVINIACLDAWIDTASEVVNPEAPGPTLVYRPTREK